MVAWRLVLCTPEYPEGRELILIANDLTYFIGSFGVKEDILFCEASKLARKMKIPRVSYYNPSNLLIFLHNPIFSLRSTSPATVEPASVLRRRSSTCLRSRGRTQMSQTVDLSTCT